jgi:hypothetical protein
MRRAGMRTLMRPETRVGFHVKCSLEVFDLNENLNLSAVFFAQFSNIKYDGNSSSGSLIRTYRRTDYRAILIGNPHG